ncbi:Phosphoenolpyruvate carboxylase kinase 2, partial [Tetrabaena socialis]
RLFPMTFLNRLFNRKSKTELSSPAPLRRSLTDPVQSSLGRNASSSDKSDNDTFDIRPPSRLVTTRRRAGCDMTRSKTSVDIGSVRSSSVASSSHSTEPLSTSADGSKNQYRQVKALHRSRMHTIMAAQDRSSKRAVVMKTFQKLRLSSTLKARIDSEIQHLRALTGVPGVVKYVNHFEDEECIYLVLERSPGTTLIELVANCGGRLSEAAMVTDVLTPLALLLADLHRRGIVHRQIKPEHVLVSPEAGRITLVDFGEAVNKKQRCLNNRAGTLEYMALLTKWR